MKINKKFKKFLYNPFGVSNKTYVRRSSFIIEILFIIMIVAENAQLFVQINSKLLPFAILNALFLIYLKF